MPTIPIEDVLTLAEAASYLRVPEGELLRLAECHDVPAQRVGEEWRFLKRALGQWLTYGPRFFRGPHDYPFWRLDHPVIEELVFLIEKRLRHRLDDAKPEPGSRRAVGKHVGSLKGEGDLDEALSKLAAIRAGITDEVEG